MEDRTKSAACDPMDVNETKQSSWSEAEKSCASDIMHKRLLEQMEWLCRIVQDRRTEWKIKSNMKAIRDTRKIRNSKKKSVTEWMERFKNEESARKLVRNVLAAMKEEIRPIKLEIGSSVCSEASIAVGTGASGTFARPLALPLATMKFLFHERWNSKGGLQTTQEVAAKA